MSYLRYHHILLIGIIVEKWENGEKNPTILYRSRFFVCVTSCSMKPCHSNNVPSNRKCVPNYEK